MGLERPGDAEGEAGLSTMERLDSRYPPTNLLTLPRLTSHYTLLHSLLMGAKGNLTRLALHQTPPSKNVYGLETAPRDG